MISAVLGLGNIGSKYAGTRHNVGFMVIEKLLTQYKPLKIEREAEYDRAEITVAGSSIIVAEPTNYMNNSGYAAHALLQDYALTPSELLVLVDDFNLPLGGIRIRRGGTGGGHNGLESIIEQLETDQFPRIRLGIGQVPESVRVVDFVLGAFERDDEEVVSEMISSASDAVISAINDGIEQAMMKYNRNPA